MEKVWKNLAFLPAASTRSFTWFYLFFVGHSRVLALPHHHHHHWKWARTDGDKAVKKSWATGASTSSNSRGYHVCKHAFLRGCICTHFAMHYRYILCWTSFGGALTQTDIQNMGKQASKEKCVCKHSLKRERMGEKEKWNFVLFVFSPLHFSLFHMNTRYRLPISKWNRVSFLMMEERKWKTSKE